jgi:prephenate dehydrogenase
MKTNVPFSKTAIIGLGLVGGSLGLAIKRKFPTSTVWGVDEAATADEAVSVGVVDRGFAKNRMADCIRDAELVILATPIQEILRLLPAVARHAAAGSLVTDVGSTKKQIVEQAAAHFGQSSFFIGGHPMAGGEGRGIRWADAFLFENAVWVMTPMPGTPVPAAQRLAYYLECLGAKVLFLSPLLHDQIASAVSHLPQMLAVALVNWVSRRQEDSPLYLKLAAGGFRDMTRIASSPYSVWNDILKTNREQIVKDIDAFVEELRAVHQAVDALDMESRFEDAAQHRLSIPKDTKGFLKPHFDIRVRVEDKPGVIAEIAGALAKESINIKDIEILKVREGDAGTLRMSLETPEARERALAILNGIGFASKPTS